MPAPPAASPRLVAGLMSGTSLDGVDAVLARVGGTGRRLSVTSHGFVHQPYPAALRTLIAAQSTLERSSVAALSQLNVRLAHVYAAAVRALMDTAGQPVDALDLIGLHGQTVYHHPTPADCAGQAVASTLQLGDPSTLATLLQVPVVGHFRQADMALGGQGAPLVPYVDWALCTSADEPRGLLNLGGIANLTVLPAGAALRDVQAFDTGPGNMVIDGLAERLLGQPFDAGGTTAASGTIANGLLADLLNTPFFAQPPPRSTGREAFGAAFLDDVLQQATAAGVTAPADLLATGTALTAASVYQAYVRFVRPTQPIATLWVSGGGVHNAFLLQKLADAFAPVPVRSVAVLGIDPDAKEALAFAVLAHETANGVPTNVPSATGAAGRAVLGALWRPTGRDVG